MGQGRHALWTSLRFAVETKEAGWPGDFHRKVVKQLSQLFRSVPAYRPVALARGLSFLERIPVGFLVKADMATHAENPQVVRVIVVVIEVDMMDTKIVRCWA